MRSRPPTTNRASQNRDATSAFRSISAGTGSQSAPVEAVVDTSFHDMHLLVDLDVSEKSGNRRDEPERVLSEVHEVVFDLGRPVPRDTPFDAAADHPAPAGLVVKRTYHRPS